MKELIEAAKKMNTILRECEDGGDTFDETLNRLGSVKVHGVSFPTLMLMEIIDEFAKGYSERQKKQFDVAASDEELQKKYAEASTKWNEKLN